MTTRNTLFPVLGSGRLSTTVFANWMKLIWRSIFERCLACTRKACKNLNYYSFTRSMKLTIYGGLGIGVSTRLTAE